MNNLDKLIKNSMKTLDNNSIKILIEMYPDIKYVKSYYMGRYKGVNHYMTHFIYNNVAFVFLTTVNKEYTIFDIDYRSVTKMGQAYVNEWVENCKKVFRGGK